MNDTSADDIEYRERLVRERTEEADEDAMAKERAAIVAWVLSTGQVGAGWFAQEIERGAHRV